MTSSDVDRCIFEKIQLRTKDALINHEKCLLKSLIRIERKKSMIKTSLLILGINVLLYLCIEHIHRRTHQLFDEIEHRGYRFIDEIEVRMRRLTNEILFQLNNQTSEQIDSVLEKTRKYLPLQNPYGATTCTEWFGCHQGYCWSGCAGAFPSLTGPEWCYTTSSNGKVPCSDNKDCNGCWRCSSPCSV